MQTFTAAPHHDVLALLVQLAVLLLSARVLAEVAQRFGQPAVVGEILAGILLGPSLLSGLVPSIGEWLVPHTATQGHLLETVSLLGALLLLLITGMETDLALIRRHARTAMGASLGGIAVPFATGFWLEGGLLLGAGLILLGTGIIGVLVVRWLRSDLLPLPNPEWASLAATLVIIGFSTLFSSLFISAMSMEQRGGRA